MKPSLKPLLFLCLLSLLATSMDRQSLAASSLPPAQPKVITTSAKYRQKPNTMPSTATKPEKKNKAAKSATVGLPVVSADPPYLFSVQPNQCNSSVSMFKLKKGTLLASGSNASVARSYQQSSAYFVIMPTQKNLTVYYLEPVGPELIRPNTLKPLAAKPAIDEFKHGAYPKAPQQEKRHD